MTGKNFIIAAQTLFVFALTSSVAFAQCQGNTLCNPLNSNFSSIPQFIAGALQVMVMVALPIITLFFVYAGFKFIAARGKSGELETAKKNFLYLVIGALLILGAWVIATLIGNTVTQLVQ